MSSLDGKQKRLQLAGFFSALAPLQEYLDDPSVNEIMINGPNDVWVEKKGALTNVGRDISSGDIDLAITSIAQYNDKVVSNDMDGVSKRIVHAFLEGFRIAGVKHPTSIYGNAMSIRKHSVQHFTLDEYQDRGHFSTPQFLKDEKAWSAYPIENELLNEFFKRLVHAGKTIVVSGYTGAGKTSLLGAFIDSIPKNERVVTIEDVREIVFNGNNKVGLLSNAEEGVTFRKLVELCMRLRPDRIIAGELKGGEAFDVAQAAITHTGTMLTLHATNARQAITRLESLILQGVPNGTTWPIGVIRGQIANTFNYFAHFQKERGCRYLAQVIHLKGIKGESNEYDYEIVYDAKSFA